MLMTVERPVRVAPALPPFDAALGKRLKQAIDVELLLQWAYADQAVTGRSVEIEGKVDWSLGGGGGGAQGGAHSHGDALIVHGYVQLLPSAVRRDVVEHALARSRPDWGAGLTLHEVRPVFTDAAGHVRDRPQVVRDARRQALFCPIVCIDRYDQVTARRLAYVDWWNALSQLGRTLRQDVELQKWLPTGPGAPPAPWGA